MIKLVNINKYYKSGTENYHALRDINLEFGDSGMHFIHGKSGSGKSTLLNVLGGIDKYDSGDLIIDNVSTAKFSRRDFNTYRNTYIGFVLQEFNVLKGLSVYENIALSLELQHMSVKKNHNKIQEIIDKVGLTGLENRMMNQISGGQRQRVAIARALIKNPRVIIADEPTGNLDSKNSKMVMDLLKELSKDHLIIVVTHSDALAKEYADRLIEIRDGSVTKDTGNTAGIDKDLVLKPVKVPVKTSLTLSLKNIFKNKMRFAVMILLFALSLTFAGVVVNLSLADTTKVYSEYQNEFGNFVLNTNKKYLSRGFETTTAFFDYELTEYQEKYNKDEESYIKVLKGMDYYIPIDENATNEDAFWTNYIQRIHLYDATLLENFEYLYGKHTNRANSVTITDYLADNLIFQNYFGDAVETREDLLEKEIYCENMKAPFIIRGIIKTNYEDFLERDLNDSKTWSAFQDNLVFYSSMFTNAEKYASIYSSSNITAVYDDVIYDLINQKGICNDVKITTYDQAEGTVHATKGKEPTEPEPGQPTQIAVTTGFLKQTTGLDGTIDELFDKIYFEVTYEQMGGSYANEYMYATVYLNAVRRVPTSISCVITDIIEDDEIAIYTPSLSKTPLFTRILSSSYGDGGFATLIIQEDPTNAEQIISANSNVYREMIENDVLISNQAFQKVLLVDDFINNNLWLFIGIFFVFCLFSVLLIFNFVIINIKNSTRDIGIYMSLGLSGFRISLIYLFQVIIMGLCSFILAAIAVIVFLVVLDIRFTAMAAVNLTIINITSTGMFAILAIALIVPISAVIIPLFNLSRKLPVDIIKSV